MALVLDVHSIAARDCAEKPDFAVTWRPALYALRGALAIARVTVKVTPNMLAAIAARETGGLNVLQYGVPPGPGCGVGPWQITSGVDWSDPANPRYPGFGELLDPGVSARVAAACFLEPMLERFPGSHQAAFAGFNLGGGAVAQEIADGLPVDAWTTDHDYGADVFTHWINFAAVSFGANVDWASYAWP